MAGGRQNGGQLELELEELKRAAERINLEVREEELLREVGYRARSGRCRLKDQQVVFIDRKLPLRERLDLLASELARHNLEGIYLSPALRRRLDRRRGRREGAG